MTPSNIDFIAHVFAGIQGNETPWVTGFPGDPNDVERSKWGGRTALPLPAFISPRNNNFIVISSFIPGDDGLQHRRKANFGRMFMLMVDDIGTKVAWDRLRLEPSALVETSPDNYQAWYFLSPPETERLRAEHLLNGMIASGLTADGADPGMKGVTRYGRLPVGVNNKAKYVAKLGGPFVQRVTVWEPTRRYSVDQIAEAYGIDMTIGAEPPRKTRKRKPAHKVPGPSHGLDDVYVHLLERAGLYLETVASMDAAHRIICPWVHEHTDMDPTGTIYFEPSEQNDRRGGFKCHHGHCQKRNINNLTSFLFRLQQLAA